MGWFEEQVKQRKSLDEKTFEDSFMSLAGLGVAREKSLSEAEQKENFAIRQILAYYRHQAADIPLGINTLREKLAYALRPHDITFTQVELSAAYADEESASPLLCFTKINRTPVVLLPKGGKGYYYLNYKTGKKTAVTEEVIARLDEDAYLFYRPLPNKKMTIKEYGRYIRSSIHPLSIVGLILVTLAASGVGLLVPYFTKLLTGQVATSGDLNQFASISAFLVASATGLLLMKAIQAYVNVRITAKIEKTVQRATMMRLLYLPASFFKKYNTGELTSRFSSVTSLVGILVNGVLVTLVAAVMSLAYLFQLVSFAPPLILPVVIILLVTAMFAVATAFVQRSYTRKVLELSSKESGVTYEMINGIQKIRLAGSEKRVFAKWSKVYSRMARARYKPPLIIRIGPAINLLIALLGNLAIYFIASRYKVSVGDYMAFTTSYAVLTTAFTSVSRVLTVILTIGPTYDMARPILETEPETDQGKKTVDAIKGDIELKDVCFRYSENGRWILDGINLHVKEGEYVAIVGKTGCGKSTLVRMLLGFETPSDGKILYDGVDIRDVDLSSLRHNIGTVMQNGTLFHADILSNIIISSPDLKEEDAWNAARTADIARDIKAMPMGMKTVISEGQGGISGGQKQRIMIARAIVHHPKVLIFDEATSALDNRTQKSISDSISKLNCTRIVIAHRLSTIRTADRIIMLEGGHIIEEGSYDELIAKEGKFAELVKRQRLDKGEQQP